MLAEDELYVVQEDYVTRNHERRNTAHTLLGMLALAQSDPGGSGFLEGFPSSFLASVGAARIEEPLVLAQLTGKAMAADDCGVSLRIVPGSSLCRVSENAEELVTILGNLIDNAVSAVLETCRAEPCVDVELHCDGSSIELCVTDNGPGVPPEMREWIFAQGSSTKRHSAGRHRGLGLALVRSLVMRRGGAVTAEGSDGGGAKFTVRMPARQFTSGKVAW